MPNVPLLIWNVIFLSRPRCRALRDWANLRERIWSGATRTMSGLNCNLQSKNNCDKSGSIQESTLNGFKPARFAIIIMIMGAGWWWWWVSWAGKISCRPAANRATPLCEPFRHQDHHWPGSWWRLWHWILMIVINGAKRTTLSLWWWWSWTLVMARWSIDCNFNDNHCGHNLYSLYPIENCDHLCVFVAGHSFGGTNQPTVSA